MNYSVMAVLIYDTQNKATKEKIYINAAGNLLPEKAAAIRLYFFTSKLKVGSFSSVGA